jgi:predicted RNase H-like nuclease (RuvC/YqgF family)
LLDRIVEVSARAEEAEAKSEELEEIVRRFTGDEAEAGRLLTRLSDLEEENTDLHGRLKNGRSGVDRLLAKIRFLEAQR